MRTAFRNHAFVAAMMAAALTATVMLVAAGTASAHVDPDPIAVQAGTTATIAFGIEHGCDGSPTTSIKFQIPTDVTDVRPVDKTGWTATVAGDIVEFKGGPLAADAAEHFDITVTVPTTPGDISFPAIQTCEKGELAWIEPVVDGAAEPTHPAPVLKITAGAPTAAELAPATDAPSADTTATGSVAPLTTAVTTAAPADDSSNGGIIAAVIGAAIVVIGGGVLLARRKKQP
jgi:periplasmic copper chaperone A